MRISKPLALSALAAAALTLSACSESIVEVVPDAAPARSAAKVTGVLATPPANDTYILSVSTGRFESVSAAVADAGGTVVRSYPQVGLLIAGGLSPEGAAALSATSGVQEVVADVMVENTELAPGGVETAPASHDPSQAYFFQLGFQWDMEIIHADDAWAAGASAEGVTVAIVDSGIDATHPDLAGLVDASRSVAFVPNQNPSAPAWGDDFFHGTHVAGTVASNGLGTAGVASHASLMAVKVCTADNSCPFSAILSGIVYSADNGADVVNMSLGGFIGKSFPGGGQLNGLLNRVMNYASSKGVVVVSAAGNGGYDLDHLGRDFRAGSFVATPCESGNGMCVSATNVLDEPTSYTNYGTSAVSLAAPGGDGLFPVLAPCSTQSVYLPTVGITCGPTSYLWATGTSMAAPHVSGAAALVKAGGISSPGRIKTVLQQTADDLGKPGTDPFYGSGRLNVAAAVGN